MRFRKYLICSRTLIGNNRFKVFVKAEAIVGHRPVAISLPRNIEVATQHGSTVAYRD